jgi:hypothetical protein
VRFDRLMWQSVFVPPCQPRLQQLRAPKTPQHTVRTMRVYGLFRIMDSIIVQAKKTRLSYRTRSSGLTKAILMMVAGIQSFPVDLLLLLLFMVVSCCCFPAPKEEKRVRLFDWFDNSKVKNVFHNNVMHDSKNDDCAAHSFQSTLKCTLAAYHSSSQLSHHPALVPFP